MRNPESTKNRSTPTRPCSAHFSHGIRRNAGKCENSTAITATARNPSNCGMYLGSRKTDSACGCRKVEFETAGGASVMDEGAQNSSIVYTVLGSPVQADRLA